MQEERNDLLQTSGMQQIKEEMHLNAKSFYIQIQKTRGHDNATTNPLLQQAALL
jgi:hypothetical protein